MGYFLLSGTTTGWEKIYIFIFLRSTLHDDDDYKNNKLKTFCATCHSFPYKAYGAEMSVNLCAEHNKKKIKLSQIPGQRKKRTFSVSYKLVFLQ